MDDGLVVRRRSVVLALATVPVVAAAVLLEIALQVTAARLTVAGVCAGAAGMAWLAWRLLTAEVRIADGVVSVRGVHEDVEMASDMIAGVTTAPAPRWLRAFMWGVLNPWVVVVQLVDGTVLRPVALWAGEDDAEVAGVVEALRRCARPPAARVHRTRSA